MYWKGGIHFAPSDGMFMAWETKYSFGSWVASIIFGYLGKFIAGFWGEGASNITWSSYVGLNNFFPLVGGMHQGVLVS